MLVVLKIAVFSPVQRTPNSNRVAGERHARHDDIRDIHANVIANEGATSQNEPTASDPVPIVVELQLIVVVSVLGVSIDSMPVHLEASSRNTQMPDRDHRQVDGPLGMHEPSARNVVEVISELLERKALP